MDWSQFSNPRGSEALQWRKVMGVPTTHVAGRRIELFKELVWKEWRHVPMWGYRVDGVAQPERFRTMRQAKAQAELHARRIIAAGETSVRPAAVPAEIETKRRPKKVPLERKEWWGRAENPMAYIHPPPEGESTSATPVGRAALEPEGEAFRREAERAYRKGERAIRSTRMARARKDGGVEFFDVGAGVWRIAYWFDDLDYPKIFSKQDRDLIESLPWFQDWGT